METPEQGEEDRRAGRRRRGREAGVVAALGVVGVILLVAGGSVLGGAVGWAVCGFAGVAAVSLVFYEIGLGEDRDRARGRRGPYDPRKPLPRPAAPRIRRAPRTPRR